MVDAIIPVGAEHSQALHALTKKYAEISGRIIHCRAEMDRLKKDLEHLKRVIEIFGPDVQVDSINIKRIISRDPFTKGKVTSFVLDILRESYEPKSPRLRTHSQKSTVAASAMAERKTFGHRS